MGDERADDLSSEESSLPQPGTKEPVDAKEPNDPEHSDSTTGPGNVSVDEPTQPAMNPDEDSGDEE
ncbi:MAG: hypothetical protein ACRDKZ_05080 [Actinomycetota bacterium]